MLTGGLIPQTRSIIDSMKEELSSAHLKVSEVFEEVRKIDNEGIIVIIIIGVLIWLFYDSILKISSGFI